MTRIILFLFIISFSSFNLYSQVVVNEIMAAPTVDEPEWIELYNYSASSVDLSGYYISDSKTAKEISELILPPETYAVITKDTLLLKSLRDIPPQTIFFQLSLPALNNTYDNVILRDPGSAAVDSCYYNMSWGEKGYSLERAVPGQPAVSNDNLKQSVSADKATCGYYNSVSKSLYDLKLKIIDNGLSSVASVELANTGKRDLDNISVSFYADLNRDSAFDETEAAANIYVNNLKSGAVDTIVFDFEKYYSEKNIFEKGISEFLAEAVFDSNDNNVKKDISGLYFIKPEKNSLLINEIMYDISEDNAEFVEIYNNSSFTQYLNGWAFRDKAADTEKEFLIINNMKKKIAPGEYFVLCWDSIIFNRFPELADSNNIYVFKKSVNLNTSGDETYLLSPALETVDSCFYQDWHHDYIDITRDVSLEKIKPDMKSNDKLSWTSCVDGRGATPGRLNSVSAALPLDAGITITPNPFSPAAAGSANICRIDYKLPQRLSGVSAAIYDVSSNKIIDLKIAETSSSEGSIIWDGRNNTGDKLQIGPYVILLETVNADTGETTVYNEMIVIGE